jgi:hypothetical protein
MHSAMVNFQCKGGQSLHVGGLYFSPTLSGRHSKDFPAFEGHSSVRISNEKVAEGFLGCIARVVGSSGSLRPEILRPPEMTSRVSNTCILVQIYPVFE